MSWADFLYRGVWNTDVAIGIWVYFVTLSHWRTGRLFGLCLPFGETLNKSFETYWKVSSAALIFVLQIFFDSSKMEQIMFSQLSKLMKRWTEISMKYRWINDEGHFPYWLKNQMCWEASPLCNTMQRHKKLIKSSLLTQIVWVLSTMGTCLSLSLLHIIYSTTIAIAEEGDWGSWVRLGG